MLKIAIVGCGKIADAHAAQIMRIDGCEIVGVCDREALMAEQLFERFPVKGCYSDLGAMLEKARPDVIHITTPTLSHYSIARQCLEHDCHVYVEKPFTLDLPEAEQLIAFAEKKHLRLTAGHNAQFTHAARRLRALVQEGYLGGDPVHMESVWCYELGGHYARALIADPNHWIRRLPGALLQNVISHGVARIAEHLTCDTPQVIASAVTSPFLRNLGETEIVDELRVIITDHDRTTAYFTFSSQMFPSLHQFRIYGPENGLLLDDDQQSVLRLRGERFKSYAEKFLPNLLFAKQHAGNFFSNLRSFLASDFHEDSSKKHLFELFYRSITEDSPPPIPAREILLTARIMDAIFDQIRDGAVDPAAVTSSA